jgi:hypothetical protein
VAKLESKGRLIPIRFKSALKIRRLISNLLLAPTGLCSDQLWMAQPPAKNFKKTIGELAAVQGQAVDIGGLLDNRYSPPPLN